MFEGFQLDWLDVGNVKLRVRHGGRGPAVLLLHGHPRTHTTWHRVAPQLARDHTVVCPDLRGYGQSSKPSGGPDHFFARPDEPERMICADPDSFYRIGRTGESMGQENFEDFRRAVRDPATVHAMLEDYRAGLGIDRAHDDADRAAGRTVACPTLVLWSAHDDDGELYPDILGIWRTWAPDLSGGPFESGHHMAEENPNQLARTLRAFLDVVGS